MKAKLTEDQIQEEENRKRERDQMRERLRLAREADSLLCRTGRGVSDIDPASLNPLCPRCCCRVLPERGCRCTKYGTGHYGVPRNHLPW